MERCSHCQNELSPGFDFCHHCGASIQTQTDPQASRMQQAVEVVDQLKGLQSQVLNTGSSARQLMNHWLGNPISLQRQIFYSLWTALALVLTMGSNPFNGKPFSWLEGWLLLAIFLLPMIHYQVTGLLPFANVVNTLLGETHSMRRRCLLALMWTVGPGVLLMLLVRLVLTPLAMSFGPEIQSTSNSTSLLTSTADGVNVNGLEALRLSLVYLSTFFGSFLINYYFMGFANSWRSISDLGDSLLGNQLVSEVDRAAELIKERIEACAIRDLEISSIAMASLRRHTAGESSGTQGQQLVLTRGRARVVIFVQDYGQNLFVRWSCYFDASGRRLWVLIGILVDAINDLFQRWTGNDITGIWQTIAKVLNPFAGGRDNVMYDQGGFFSRLFRLEASISEYSSNEVFALEGSIRESIEKVLGEVGAVHHEAEFIRSQNQARGQLEQAADQQRRGTSPAAGERHTP